MTQADTRPKWLVNLYKSNKKLADVAAQDYGNMALLVREMEYACLAILAKDPQAQSLARQAIGSLDTYKRLRGAI